MKESLVILITRNGMGHADQTLQHTLISKYLSLLDDHDQLPAAICMYADGVKLAIAGSPVIPQLKALEAKGVRIILCSTCLNHFDLAGQEQVGIVGGMTDIIEAQWRSEKVVTL